MLLTRVCLGPRHLHTGYEICIRAKLPSCRRLSGSDPSHGQLSASFSSSSFPHGESSSSLPTLSGPSSSFPQKSQHELKKPHLGRTRKSPLTGLLRPGVRGGAARRKAPGVVSGQQKQKERDRNSKEKQKEAAGTGSGIRFEQVYTIIEQFVRLSALAAAELELERLSPGREVRRR